MRDRAGAHPHRPWLFFPYGHDWRWLSWEDGAREMDQRVADGKSPWPAEPTVDAVLDALAMRRTADPATASDTLVAARRWSDLLDGRRSRREPVDLWVAGCMDRPRERELWAWSILSGAGLILPGEDARRVGATLWARPTVASGDGAETARLVIGLRERAASRGFWSRRLGRLRRGPDLPLGRLHTLVVTGSEPVAEDDQTWLEAAGVRVLHDLEHAAP